MFAISLKEFRRLFKSIRSVLIILTIWGVTVGAARLMRFIQTQTDVLDTTDNIYAGGISLLLLIFGPLFVTSLSHDIINKEISTRTIRFIATKTSRRNIIIGKFLGVVWFWFVCLIIAFLLLLPYAKAFYFPEFAESLIFMIYLSGLTLFLSTVINKPSMTIFIGMMLAILLPVFGIWSLGTENIFIKAIGYVTPYYYYSLDVSYFAYIVVLFPIIFVALSLLLFRKKDL